MTNTNKAHEYDWAEHTSTRYIKKASTKLKKGAMPGRGDAGSQQICQNSTYFWLHNIRWNV
jgi:hypothetical protein